MKPVAVFLLFSSLAARDALAFLAPQRQSSPRSRWSKQLEAKRVRRIDTTTADKGGVAASPSSRSGARRPRGVNRPRSRQATATPPVATKRAPHQFDHTKEEARPFVDALSEIQNQESNENAPAYELENEDSSSSSSSIGDVITHSHIETFSLDDLFPGLDFSNQFSESTAFRTDLRNAIREDVFDTTPTYHGMSEKARKVLLLPDSSLQGSWKCKGGGWSRGADIDDTEKEQTNDSVSRMERLTNVLKQYLGPNAPTGDEFMDTIGSLCGPKPSSTHWIDMVGVLTRRVPRSWCQDTGRSPQDSRTVLLGFPARDHYDGVGVFDHVIKLKRERHASSDDHPVHEPVLYGAMSQVDDKYIVRPRFAKGRELIAYRDIDVLHSSPDVAYRMSVMRFM